MAIKLERVDFRLMHGQVVTNWIKQVSADAILIVDNDLASDKFLAQVFLMAAPPGVKISIKSIEKAVQAGREGKYDKLNILVLFKSVENAKRAYDLGFPMESLQIGGLGNGEGRIMISLEIGMTREEVSMLQEMESKGVKVSLQVTPKDPKIALSEAVKEINKV